MDAKFPPSFLCDVDKGLKGAFSRLYAVDALLGHLTVSGRHRRLRVRTSHGNGASPAQISVDIGARGNG